MAGGVSRERVHQLRDSAFLSDETGNYRYYSKAGESGIAVAIFENTRNNGHN